jgi:hypothetical protein
MTIEEILTSKDGAESIISALKKKSIVVPAWEGEGGLRSQYDPKMHPVMDESIYPNIMEDDGHVDYVPRITLGFQKLAAKRMTELMIVSHVYKPENDNQKQVAEWMDKIFHRNRIDSVNTDRLVKLYAGCEFFTIWYAVEQPMSSNIYGFSSKLKLRCRTFSPMDGDSLYPMFDEYGDMVAMSIGYKRRKDDHDVNYFDTYTANKHYRWSDESGGWQLVESMPEEIKIAKIPGVYCYRPEPIWEDTSNNVYEIEWSLSRDGHYLKKNSKPVFAVFADEQIAYGDSKDENGSGKDIMQYPTNGRAEYITWQQAIENLKFYTNELRSLYFTQLQLPDWSYEKMSQVAMSGESRKQLFIDCMLKVKDESGRLLEAFDREVNVVKGWLKVMMPHMATDIDTLVVETQITPFTIDDEKDTISNLLLANGNKPIMSQRESIEAYGQSSDVDQTMKEIADESKQDVFKAYE